MLELSGISLKTLKSAGCTVSCLKWIDTDFHRETTKITSAIVSRVPDISDYISKTKFSTNHYFID